MSSKRFCFSLSILAVLMLMLISCDYLITDCGDDQEILPPLTLKGMVTFDINGENLYKFPSEYNDEPCWNGVVTAMHDNKRFVLTNEHIFIFNSDTHSIESYLTSTEIDYTYNGLERIGISIDDRYIAFTNDHNLFLLDLIEKDSEMLTTGCFDIYPKIGIDNRIYFCRYLIESDESKLMSIDLNGENMEELFVVQGQITQIFPGQSNYSKIYLICDMTRFVSLDPISNTINEIHNFEYVNSLISRTDDNRYFNFSGYDVRQYCFDTELNVMTEYLYPAIESGDFLSIMFPGSDQGLVYEYNGTVNLKLWNISENEEIEKACHLDETTDWGGKTIAISPDGKKVSILHAYYNDDYY